MVAITGNAKNYSEEEFKTAGFNDVLVKPSILTDLLRDCQRTNRRVNFPMIITLLGTGTSSGVPLDRMCSEDVVRSTIATNACGYRCISRYKAKFCD
ncbi:MAG: hypothetical protein R2822_17880 [Spirosomataceae bacterium]